MLCSDWWLILNFPAAPFTRLYFCQDVRKGDLSIEQNETGPLPFSPAVYDYEPTPIFIELPCSFSLRCTTPFVTAV